MQPAQCDKISAGTSKVFLMEILKPWRSFRCCISSFGFLGPGEIALTSKLQHKVPASSNQALRSHSKACAGAETLQTRSP